MKNSYMKSNTYMHAYSTLFFQKVAITTYEKYTFQLKAINIM